MSRLKFRDYGVLICISFFLLLSAGDLKGQPPRSENESPETQVDVVPFSHLDLMWAGTREECLARGNKIIARAIEIAEKHPQFRFFIESDNFLANYMESHPKSKEAQELKQLVREGRIALAPYWAGIFNDFPAGEVTVRNLYYGKQYARQVFGVNPLVIMPDDIPGFFSQFPQVLREADIAYLVLSRMGPAKKSLFNWISPDGSRVLVWNEWQGGYGWGVNLGLHRTLTKTRIAGIQKELNEVHQVSPGPIFMPWGMDLFAPSEKLVENLPVVNHDLPHFRFVFSTPQSFFQSSAKTSGLPTLAGAIPSGWPALPDGTVMWWQLEAPATVMLTNIEKFATVNDALGYAAYPRRDLDTLWKNLIEAMDHNNGGQGGRIGDDRKINDLRLVLIRGSEILQNMLRNIAEQVEIPIAPSTPIVVFNGLGFARNGVVRAHVSLYGNVVPGHIADYLKGMRLVDQNGKAVPFAIEETRRMVSEAFRLVFVAHDVPALGYKTYYLVPETKVPSFLPASKVHLSNANLAQAMRPLGEDVMENQFYRVTVDDATGEVTVFDKQLNRVICRGMRIVAADERGSNDVQPELDTGVTFPMAVRAVTLGENNAVRTVLKISGTVGRTPVVQRLILYRGLKRLDIVNTLNWKSGPPYVRIEQLFPIEQTEAKMTFGVPFGANSVSDVLPGAGPNMPDEINRQAWEHYRAMHGWIFAGNATWGMTLAADHEIVNLKPGLIRADMIREPLEAVPTVSDGKTTTLHYPFNGRYTFRYSLSSEVGDWKAQRSYRKGLRFNNPLIPVEVVDNVSSKSLPPADSFFSIQGGNLILSALKESESDNAVIVRLYEIQGKKTETPVVFLGKRRRFRETNLLEQDLRDSEERILTIEPYQIRTLRLEINRDASTE